MELDTDVLRSSYLADIPNAGSHTARLPVLWERTRCPDPVVARDVDVDQYGVKVVHVENTAFGRAEEEYRVTCNVNADCESPSLVIDLNPEQTTRCELGKGQNAATELDSDDISSVEFGHESENGDSCSRNCTKGRRKQQVPKVADEYVGHVESSEEQVACPDTVQNPGPESNDVQADKSLTENHSSNQMPSLQKRKMSTEKPHLPPVRFRFGHYPYDQKKRKEGDLSSVSTNSGTVSSQNQTKRHTQRQSHSSWNVPENRVNSGNCQNEENPLASLFRYCDAVSSREGSDLQSLRNDLVTEKYNAFMGTLRQPNPGSHYETRINDRDDNRYQPPPNACPVGMNWNNKTTPVEPVSAGGVDDRTVDSLSYGNMLLSYHNDMLYRRRMMMNDWYHVKIQGGSRSWHKPSHCQPPQPAKKSRKESGESSRSRLFGISISRNCDTDCLVTAADKVSNKENLPRKSLSCDTETPAVMDDSGIGSIHGNSSFETDTDIPNTLHPSTGSYCQDPSDVTSATSVFDTHRSPETEVGTAENIRHFPCNDIDCEVARRRKYIIEAMYSEYVYNNTSHLDPITSRPPEIQSSQAEVYTLVDPPTRTNPLLLQDFRDPSKTPRTPTDSSLCAPPPPLQDNSGRRNTDPVHRADLVHSMETSDVGFQNKMPEALSDFQALVEAFDQSPVKSTVDDSQNRDSYPVLAAALNKKKNTKKCSEEVMQSLSQKITKTYACKCCGKTDLVVRVIRRHNLRKHSCPWCQKRFCLEGLLNKHIKANSCLASKDC